jgi:hypothetical protein
LIFGFYLIQFNILLPFFLKKIKNKNKIKFKKKKNNVLKELKKKKKKKREKKKLN